MMRTLRILLFDRRNFTIYLRSGNVLRFTAKGHYTYTKPGANISVWKYDFGAMKPYHNIDWSQVEAVKEN